MSGKPKNIKGTIRIPLQEIELAFADQSISEFGVISLPMPEAQRLEPTFGRAIGVRVEARDPTPIGLKTTAYVTRETSGAGVSFGLRFRFDQETRAKFRAYADEHGFEPVDYARQFPRIPGNGKLKTFPLKAIGTPVSDPALTGGAIAFDVLNLSPNGLLISTENSLTGVLQPGDKMWIKLEPRGQFPSAITLEGEICRVVEEIHSGSGNLSRSFGMKISAANEENRVGFLTLLKEILASIQASG